MSYHEDPQGVLSDLGTRAFESAQRRPGPSGSSGESGSVMPIPDLTLRRLRTIRLFGMTPFLLRNKLKSKDRPRLPFQFSSDSRFALNPIFRLDAEYVLTILSEKAEYHRRIGWTSKTTFPSAIGRL